MSLTRAVLKRNQFGGDVGGPVSIPHVYDGKNRTFFFFDYEGLRQVAGQVFLSTHTVAFHLRHIFWKLGVTSRVELARQAAQQTP